MENENVFGHDDFRETMKLCRDNYVIVEAAMVYDCIDNAISAIRSDTPHVGCHCFCRCARRIRKAARQYSSIDIAIGRLEETWKALEFQSDNGQCYTPFGQYGADNASYIADVILGRKKLNSALFNMAMLRLGR